MNDRLVLYLCKQRNEALDTLALLAAERDVLAARIVELEAAQAGRESDQHGNGVGVPPDAPIPTGLGS
jgi:hypothetical protein